MKKFVNDPQASSSRRCCKGIALANPDTLKYVPDYNLIMRADAPERQQGLDRPGLRLRARAGARDDRSARACSTPPVPATCSPHRRWTTCSRPPSCSPRPRACCCWSTTTPATGWPSTWPRSWPRPRTSTSRTLFIDDDVAVQDSTWTVGRRGVAGNFFVMKAVGAAAEKGADLDELVRIGEKVNSVTRTMGMALTACTPPAKGSPLFELRRRRDRDGRRHPRRARPPPGEAAPRRTRSSTSCSRPSSPTCRTQSGDRVALMINGLGGTPISELYLALRPRPPAAGRPGHHGRAAATSASTAPRSTWPARRSRWSSSTTRSSDLLSAPAEIAIRIF